MRAMWMVICIVFAFAFLGFLVSNVDTRVPVTLGMTDYEGVPLSVVVVVAIVFTAVLVGIGAVAEGTKDRLENRRLRRELHKLETEINYLRTQPTSAPAAPPSATSTSAGATDADEADHGQPPSAPVYGDAEGEWAGDADDDVYSGGRAV
ncbi:MAG TPA: lipopolysaccharide assembly protein LapA domain-containing protein [Candidatus Polarisedimenticolaceae bacterium]|nr:lipopolysaccharide assembly protein LapA domain-containing protein [Candidatus Polarisedimenticolaceae bacterium]